MMQRSGMRIGAGRPLAFRNLFIIIGLAAMAFLAAAPWAQASVEDADLPSAQKSLAPASSSAPSGPVLFPASQAGWPGEVREAGDTAPYLAFHKAAAARRAGELSKGMLREEPTPNQDLYDAIYYDLNFDLNPSQQILTGVVTMTASVTAGPLSEVDLDLADDMNVSAVTVGGTPVAYVHGGDILAADLDRAYNTGEVFTVTVSYSGNPAGDAWGWNTNGGQPMIWTLSEPFGARTWWPCKDYSHDKADSVDIRVTAPTTLITASNGTLREQTDDGVHSFAWWHESYPIATYLVSLAVHPFHYYSDWYTPMGGGDPMEIAFYNFPGSIPEVEPVQAKVKNMIEAFAQVFGEYPFLEEKYGHAEFPWGGGMEHQTCTSLGYFGEGVVAHELGHMWWGDMVTCATFHDIWLNEGFATYSEAIWLESQYGADAYRNEMLLAQFFGPGTIYVPDLSNWNRIFDSNLSYNKASWIPHMLRGMFGDAAFFQFLADYRAAFEYGAATTEEFKNVAEGSFGVDLDPFINQWIYGEYYPIYTFSWSAEPGGGGYDITLDVEQIQSWQIFNMPIEVVVTTASGEESFQVQNDEQAEQYVLNVAEEPLDVALDPDNWILRVVLAPIPEPTFENDLLLVNGVEWSTYGSEITSAYEDNAFSGSYSFDFWDCFDAPAGGYPSTLPAPLGHGDVPGEVLAQYKTVIWVGNNFGGDQSNWNSSPIYGYLQAGGNVLLMTRMAETFLVDPYRDYLGIDWSGTNSVYDCVAAEPGLTNIGRIGTQSYVSRFDKDALGPESTLLYLADLGWDPDAGLGVIRIPAQGGTHNPDGGRFALLNGRPYRWNHQDLNANVDYILGNYLGLGDSSGAPEPVESARLALYAPSPNPFRENALVRFSLPGAGPVRLGVWDVHGRDVRTLVDGVLPSGPHAAAWDGLDKAGHPAPSGIYYLRLDAESGSAAGKVLRVR